MSESSGQTFFYNLAENQLIVGQAAYEGSIDSGADPLDIVPLQNLLTQPDQPQPLVPAQVMDVKRWKLADFVSHVAWIGNEVIDDPNTSVTEEHFGRAHSLGLGASTKRMGALNGGLSRLYQAADVKNSYKRGIYDDWTKQKFGQYVGEIARRTPKNESLRDRLNQIARENKGPSSKVIKSRVGSIGQALELSGLIDPNSMNQEDYIDWGVRFYLANDGKQLDTAALEYLSPRRLSPSRSGIVRNFRSLESFRIDVEAQYTIEKKRRDERSHARFGEIMTSLGDGSLPAQAVSSSSSFEEMAQAAAQYIVASRLVAPSLRPHELCNVAKMQVDNFVARIIRESGYTLTAADVEESAEVFGVFDDIWPFDDFMRTLRLPDGF